MLCSWEHTQPSAFCMPSNFHDPETLWTDVLRKNPNCWMALNNFGLLKQQSGKVDEATSMFRHSLVIHPDQPEAHNSLNIVLLDSGKVTEAIDQIRLITSRPAPCTYHYLMGLAYQNQCANSTKQLLSIAKPWQRSRTTPSIQQPRLSLAILSAYEVPPSRHWSLQPEYFTRYVQR